MQKRKRYNLHHVANTLGRSTPAETFTGFIPASDASEDARRIMHKTEWKTLGTVGAKIGWVIDALLQADFKESFADKDQSLADNAQRSFPST